jgi:rod shape-determining protein MreC
MQKRLAVIIPLILLFIFLIFIFNITNIPILSEVSQQIAGPPKSLLYGLRVDRGGDINKKLLTENEELRKKLADYERLKRDNEALRGQFEAGQMRGFMLLPARILGSKGSFTKPSELIIDQGEKSGVKRGMAVVFKNNLLGKVEKVSVNFSKVILTSSREFSTLARTSETNALGVARGEGDFILFDQVSINERISAGQFLLTRGKINEEGFGIPADLIIGKILEVDRNESLPSQSAKVESSVETSRIETVFIIKQ